MIAAIAVFVVVFFIGSSIAAYAVSAKPERMDCGYKKKYLLRDGSIMNCD